MTRVRAWIFVTSEDDVTVDIDAKPDDIGTAEVLEAVQREHYPFNTIEVNDFEVDDDAA